MERQDTALLPWGKYATIALSAFTALVLLMATVYAAGSAINNKADQSQVDKLRDDQSLVKQDIAVIKNDISLIKNDISLIKEWIRPPGDNR